jgi:hypothetical protein
MNLSAKNRCQKRRGLRPKDLLANKQLCSRTYRSSVVSAVLACIFHASASHSAPLLFESTSNPGAWQVATNISGIDGQLFLFPASGFVGATSISGRESEGINWIANNNTGSNGYLTEWTQFIFRQSFDLTGYDPSSAVLKFQWAADDSGIGGLAGSWKPQYKVNNGILLQGAWPSDYSYDFGPQVALSNNFVSGINTIDFYVQGNGVTDGFALKSLGLTANTANNGGTEVPGSLPILGVGFAYGFSRRLRSRIRSKQA